MPPTPPAPHGAGPGRAWLASPLLPLAVLVGGGALAGAAALRLLDRDWFDDGLHYYRAHAAHGALHDKVVRRAVVGLWLTAAVVPAAVAVHGNLPVAGGSYSRELAGGVFIGICHPAPAVTQRRPSLRRGGDRWHAGGSVWRTSRRSWSSGTRGRG
jgi:hypothetical protein